MLSPDVVLSQALRDADSAGMPPINVSPTQGQFLQILARSINARRILEIGTLAGYSTIWMARALPVHGRLITLEIDPKHAAIASANIERAGLSDRVDVRLGPALETMPRLAEEAQEPFDFVFIDADKQNIPAYFEWAIRLSRPGSVIIVDNVVRDGAVVDASSTDPGVQGVRALNELIRDSGRVAATTVQTVGIKGYDGFTIALVGHALP
jgi:predicted O-methyltransferase YrrM